MHAGDTLATRTMSSTGPWTTNPHAGLPIFLLYRWGFLRQIRHYPL
jgi:hypothetical protein